MNKKKKTLLLNGLFFGFIFFLFTPYGLSTKAKLVQGLTYIKGLIISPNFNDTSNRQELTTFNVNFIGIHNASNINLTSLKDKVIFINHWATWCPPCRAEMPSLHKLYNDYKDQVAFIFLTTDTDKEVKAYYNNQNFDFPTYNLASQLPKQLSTSSIPATYIIDKNGKIALSEFGPADWNSKKVRKIIDQLLVE